jgi:hypothetical protein
LIAADRKMQEEVDAGRHAQNAPAEEGRQTAPIDRSPQSGDAEQLARNAAD